MIICSSWPPDLSKWDQEKEPFYLEVFGEAEPVLDMSFAEVVPAGSTTIESTPATPVYEYWWTIGHGGHGPEHRHLFEGRKNELLWSRLAKIAASIYLYFPISGGGRAHELIGTVKYLSPVPDQQDWSEKAAADWQRAEPALASAGQIALGLATIPGIGVAATGAAPILSALSKVKVGNVPQGVKGFDGYVEKVTFGPSQSRGVMQGVVWALPKTMFERLGGRLTGSLALSLSSLSRKAQTIRIGPPNQCQCLLMPSSMCLPPTRSGTRRSEPRSRANGRTCSAISSRNPWFPFEGFWASLDDVFCWLVGTLHTPALPRAQYGKLDATWEAPKAITSWRKRVPLELLRYAGANWLKVDVDYRAEQGRQGARRVEPYSLRRAQDGNLVLFVVNDYVELRSYRVDRIAAIRPTAVQFTPKFRVEL